MSRYLIPAVGLAALAVFVLLYVNYPAVYLLIMDGMIKVPAPRPFADGEWIWSSIRCWSEGVNVYVNVTCFKVWPNTTFGYSPLWLRAVFLKTLDEWSNATGLTMAVLFLLSLASLPRRRTPWDQVIVLLVALSSGTVLALERGNLDIAMFLMLITALNLFRLSLPFRLTGYALITLAGLLKFYPFVALIIVLRERPAVVLAVALASSAALGSMVLAYHEELGWMSHNLPPPSWITLQFGASNLPNGLGITIAKILENILHENPDQARATGDVISRGLAPMLVIAAVAFAISLQSRLPSALARLSERERDFLVMGAALICGCFFAGQSVLYRGVYLLLAIPGLATISGHMPAGIWRWLFRGASIAIALVMWIPFLESCLALAGLTMRINYLHDAYAQFPISPAGYLLWLSSELAWWWIVTVLLAVTGAFVIRTEPWSMLCRLLRLPKSWRVEQDAG